MIRDCEPLQKLFESVTMLGTVDEPLFRLTDVASYVNDDRPSRTTRDFDQTQKVTHTYYDGKQNRSAHFLTEHGLYDYMITLRTTKAQEFRTMVIDILKQIRRQVINRLTDRLENVAEFIRDMPYPEDIDDQVQYRIASWTTRNIANTSAVHFPAGNVTKRTRDCIKKCILLETLGDIPILMHEAYDDFHNLLILGIDGTTMPTHEKYENENYQDED